MVGAVLKGETLAAIGAAGVRKLGSPEPFQVTDRIHLGSDTKAMTATMLATLVEEGKLDWASTIRKVFPARSKDLHPDFKDVTLWQLLTHRAGLPANGPWWELKGRTTTEKRRDLLSRMMKDAPETKPGTTHAYSNVGYAIAGLMAEQVTGHSWEDLMRERLFDPLGMTIGRLRRARDARRRRPALGPPRSARQGRARFRATTPPRSGRPARSIARRPTGRSSSRSTSAATRAKARLLKPATFRFLHTPAPGTNYGGGWLVVDRSWAGGRALTHSGSNTMWYCTVWVAPARDFAVLVATNLGGDAAAKACDEAVGALIRLEPTVGKG